MLEFVEVLGDYLVGWFGEMGYKDFMEVVNMLIKMLFKFEEMYYCDLLKKYYGFMFWDDFFICKIMDKFCFVVSLDDDKVVVNSCEFWFYCVVNNVKLWDRFWVKG